MTYKIKAGRYLHFCPSYNVSVNAAYTECVSDMFHICRDYSNVCSKPSTHKTKLKENKMDTLNQGKEDKNKDIIENIIKITAVIEILKVHSLRLRLLHRRP